MRENFTYIASDISVQNLLLAIERKPELWSHITLRQDTAGSAHADTETIFLRWAKALDVQSVFNDLIAVNYPCMKFLPEAADLIAQVMKLVEGTELGRVIVTKLAPYGHIDMHFDDGAYADKFERFHLVLQSDVGNHFLSGPNSSGHFEDVHMRPGELWCFNHKKLHTVSNLSDSDRIHLILDIVAPKFRKERE